MTPIVKFIGFLLLYFLGVWLVLAFIPLLSVAARVRMSGRLWLYDIAGFLFGMYIGSCLVDVALGGRPLPYGHWDMHKYREPKTFIGNAVLLVIVTAAGVFFANMTVRYGIRHP